MARIVVAGSGSVGACIAYHLALLGARDGVAEPAALTREVVRRAAELGVEVLERTDARELEREVLVIAAGAYSGEFGVELPIRPLARQLLETDPLDELPDDLPMVIEAESDRKSVV